MRIPSSPIGLGDGAYDEHRLTLGPGDRLYMFSDGLIEALDGKVPADVQITMLNEGNRLIDRGVAWILSHAPHPIDMGKLKTMLAMGASKPWPEALTAVTGEKQMDATAIADYFAPLNLWLTKQNKGEKAGW